MIVIDKNILPTSLLYIIDVEVKTTKINKRGDIYNAYKELEEEQKYNLVIQSTIYGWY